MPNRTDFAHIRGSEALEGGGIGFLLKMPEGGGGLFEEGGGTEGLGVRLRRIGEFGGEGWESLALLQGSFGPFGPKVANRVRKWVPGPSRPRGPKSPKRSRKRVKIDYFSTILTLFRLRFGLFGPRGREGPGTHFRTLFATFGPKGPNDPKKKSFRKGRGRYIFCRGRNVHQAYRFLKSGKTDPVQFKGRLQQCPFCL